MIKPFHLYLPGKLLITQCQASFINPRKHLFRFDSIFQPYSVFLVSINSLGVVTVRIWYEKIEWTRKHFPTDRFRALVLVKQMKFRCFRDDVLKMFAGCRVSSLFSLSLVLLKATSKYHNGYPILCNYILSIQEYNKEDPILHLKKVRNIMKIRKFLLKLSGMFIVEKKVDGISCYLMYKDGLLIRATTKKGLDILWFAKHIKTIPRRVRGSFTGGVRGEIFISKKDLAQINEGRDKKFKSAVSALTGLLISEDRTYEKKVGFQAYLMNSRFPPKTQLETIRRLKLMGFNRNIRNFHESFTLPKDAEKLYRYIKNRKKREDEFAINIDGLVIKANNIIIQRIERKNIAFKYR